MFQENTTTQCKLYRSEKHVVHVSSEYMSPFSKTMDPFAIKMAIKSPFPCDRTSNCTILKSSSSHHIPEPKAHRSLSLICTRRPQLDAPNIRPAAANTNGRRVILCTFCKEKAVMGTEGEEAVMDFQETRIPLQKWREGIPFPRVIVPVPSFAHPPTGPLAYLVQAIRRHRAWLESHLHSSGAVLLRDFSIHSASDFNEVVEAFGYEELPYVGGAAPRTKVVGRVFTANESPPDQKIPFHHEMAQVPEYPAKLFFFCEVEPGEGGETPIVQSHLVYKKMLDQFPEFVRKLEEHGVIYIRVLGEGDDPSSPIGRGWQSTFLTKDKDEAERRAARLGMKLEWLENGGVKTIMGPIPAIKIDGSRGCKIWFNSMVAAYTGWKDARNDPEKAVTFGDGTPLPADVILACLRILDEESVAVPWQKGDVLLLDNLAVLHSRRSFEPPRRILASLCK